MNYSRIPTPLAALRCSLICSFVAGMLAAQDVKKTEESQDPAAPKKLEAFEVTGSRVKRLD